MRQILIRLNTEAELRELRNAATVRQELLKKAIDRSMKELLPAGANEAREKLALWQGKDGEPGIAEIIAEQMNVFEPAYEEPQTREQRDVFEDEAPTAAAEGGETVEADYEIVEEDGSVLGSYGGHLRLASGD